MTPTKGQDLARLAEIADLLDERELMFHERRLIWARRLKAGDCATTAQPQDRGQGELARISRVASAQVANGVKTELLERARRALAEAKK